MAYYNYKIVRNLMISEGFIRDEDCWGGMKQRYAELHDGDDMEWSGDYDCDFWTLTGDFIVWLVKRDTLTNQRRSG